MFIGHYGVGLAAKSLAPKTSLGTLILAALFPDVLWIIFAYAGVEHIAIKPGITAVNALELYDFPFSHSLLMDVFWAAALASLYFGLRRYSRGAWVVGAAALSHWLLDLVAHRPDMPLAPGVHAVFGIGLWNSRFATFIVEGGMWFAGIILYLRATRPASRGGTYGFWIMVVPLTALWLLSLRGTPPPSLEAVEIVNLLMFVITLAWAYWIDRIRPVRAANAEGAAAAS
jgi:hypothetical protein